MTWICWRPKEVRFRQIGREPARLPTDDTAPGNMAEMAELLRKFFHDRELHVIERAVFAIDECEPRDTARETP